MIHPRSEIRARARPPVALFLSEESASINEGAGFLNRLPPGDIAALQAAGTPVSLDQGKTLFLQGQVHAGVWIIQEGTIRTYYVGADGRELTLAYWTAGHFVGGPELFGGGRHIWSAVAHRPAKLSFQSGPSLRRMAEQSTSLALALIDGLVAKGKCYSALVQILGTRSASERLELILGIMADTHGRPVEDGVLIDRTITHQQLALMLGTSRQWLSVSLEKLRAAGRITLSRHHIVLHNSGS